MQDTAKVPRKSEDLPAGGRPLIDDQLADELLGKAQAEGVELLGTDGLLSQVTKAVLERALAEEMTGHLGYEKHDPAGRGSGNNRNGTTGKTVLTDIGAVDLAVPRDRNGSFDPQIVRKGQTRLDGFNDRDHRLVRARDDHPRHRRPPARDVWRRSLPRPDQPGHRRGRRAAGGVAGPAAGPRLISRGGCES